jgi:hypothetical protein
MYQDSDKTLWGFNMNKAGNIYSIKSIPFEKYKIDLSGALIGQSGVKGELPKTNPEPQKKKTEKKDNTTASGGVVR